MGLKDVFKSGDWKRPMGKSYHGGNAFEGRGSSPADAAAKSEARKLKREVRAAEGRIRGCKKCSKISGTSEGGVCRKHIKDASFIANNS